MSDSTAVESIDEPYLLMNFFDSNFSNGFHTCRGWPAEENGRRFTKLEGTFSSRSPNRSLLSDQDKLSQASS